MCTALAYLSALYWVLGSALYSLKLCSPQFDRLTRFGKLAAGGGTQRAVAAGLRDGLPHGRMFTMFYVVGALWTAMLLSLDPYVNVVLCTLLSVLASTLGVRVGDDLFTDALSASPLRRIVLIVFLLHLVRRVYECFFVHVFSPRRTSWFLVSTGLSFYRAMGVTIFAATDVGEVHYVSLAIGLFLVLVGSVIQHRAHVALAALRPAAKESALRYVVPTGGLFRFVACPHYLAEIIIYFGFAVMGFGGSYGFLLVLPLVFVVFNLAHAAHATLDWYRTEFKSPIRHNLKALIPFVW